LEQPISTPPAQRFFGVSFDPAKQAVRWFERQDLDRELADQTVFSWVDIEAPDIAPLNDVLRRMGIDLVLVSHFGAPEVLPRIVERSDCLAFYLYPVYEPEHHLQVSSGIHELEFARVLVVVGADFVITYHQRPVDEVGEVRAACEASFRLAGRTPGFIVFLLLQACLYDYAHINLANDNALDLLHGQLQAGQRDEAQDGIAVAGRNILTLKKLAASVHLVLMVLATKRNPYVSEGARASFQEMLQNALAIRGSIDSSRDLLDGLVNSIQAEAASRTSEIAKVLTVVSSIVLPLSLIAGIYGMNFENMPELKWHLGYFGVLGVMGGVAGGLVLLFWRLGWLGVGSRRRRRRT
jgi:magnesium transporter